MSLGTDQVIQHYERLAGQYDESRFGNSYGFKDLRVLNTLPGPFCFRLAIRPESISASVCSPVLIEPWAVEFVRTGEAAGTCSVETRRRLAGAKEFHTVAVSSYRRIGQVTGTTPSA